MNIKKLADEKILNATIIESLIIFLFIFLTIASIYKQQIEEKGIIPVGHEARPLNELIISDSLMNEIAHKALVSHEDSLKIEKVDSLIAKVDSLKQYIEDHVFGNPPPCKIQGNDKLFTIKLMPGYNLEITFKNLDEPIIIYEVESPILRINNNKTFSFTLSEFRNFGKKLHDSKFYNEDTDYCDPDKNKKWESDSRCVLCIYHGDYYMFDSKVKEKELESFKLSKDELIQQKNNKLTEKNKLSNKLSGLFGNKNNIKNEIKIINKNINQLDKKIETTHSNIDNIKKLLKENKISNTERRKMHLIINQYFSAYEIKK